MKIRDLVNAAVQSATEELFPALTSGDLSVDSQQTMLEDLQSHERQAAIYERAIQATYEFGKMTTKSILLMMVDYEINQYYRFLSSPYNSLEEFAVESFGNHTEDKNYILRLCTSVKKFLIPAHAMKLKTDSGSLITAESIIEMATIRILKEVNFYFMEASPEEKKQIVRAIVAGDTYSRTKNTIVSIVEKEEEQVPTKMQYSFTIFQLNEGYKIEAVVKDSQLYALQSLFDGIAEFKLDTGNASL